MQLNFKDLYEGRFPSSLRPPDYGQINSIACEVNSSLKSQWYFFGKISHEFSFIPFLSKSGNEFYKTHKFTETKRMGNEVTDTKL